MKAVWVVVGIAAVAGGAVAATMLVKGMRPTFEAAPPNRELAPDTLVYYAEARDLRTAWGQMQGTQAWQDLQSSSILGKIREREAVQDVLASIEEASRKASYELNTANWLKLVGRECSIGFELDDKGGRPNVLLLTKLDVDALTQDLLSGKADWRALQEELNRRTGALEFSVTTAPYHDFTIATATRGTTTVHTSLLGDTLILASTKDLVQRTIDVQRAGGTGSLARLEKFRTEIAALPHDATAFDWIDLERLDAQRTALDAALTSFGAEAAHVGAAHRFLDETKGAKSLARAALLPGGDLYQVDMTYSRGGAELFADAASPAMRDVLPGPYLAYVEARDLGAVARAFDGSALRRHLAEGAFGDKVREFLDKPAESMEAMKKLAPMAGPSGDMEAPDSFVLRFALHVMKRQLNALSGGDVALGFDWTGESDDVVFVAAARLDTEGRIAASLAEALMPPETNLREEKHGGRRVIGWAESAGEDPMFWWTQIGDVVVLSNEVTACRAAVDAIAGGDAAAKTPSAVTKAVGDFEPGWCCFGLFDFDRLRRSIGTAAESGDDMPEEARQMLDSMLAASRVATAVYVPADFAHVEVRARTWTREDASANARALVDSMQVREPRSWQSLPETTIGHGAMAMSLAKYFAVVREQFPAAISGDIDSGLAEADEALGMSIERDLLPALGPEVSFAMTFQAAPAPPPEIPPGMGGPPAIPGFLLFLEVQQEEVVRRAVERALELGNEAAASEGGSEMDGEPAPQLFEREKYRDTEIVRMVVPEGQMPVHPALAFHDGFLILCSDAPVLRACIDARSGQGTSVARSPLLARATERLGRTGSTYALLDWSRFMDQMSEWAPKMGGFVPGGPEVPYPEFPEDGNMEEWERRLEEHSAKQAEAAKAGSGTVRKYIDALRVIDYVGASSRGTADVQDSTFVVRFTD